MALTADQIQERIDAISLAIGSAELKVRFADGKEVLYRSMDDMQKAISYLKALLFEANGQTGSRATYAQHSRGEWCG